MRPFKIDIRWKPNGEPEVAFVPLFKGRTVVTWEDLRQAWGEVENGLRAFESGRLQSLTARAEEGQ